MNLKIKLTADDLAECADVINLLTEAYDQPMQKTTIGIMGEYAAIKFINLQLWKIDRLELNKNYINGGDGGYDFIIGKDKWDVKTFGKNSTFNPKEFKSKADVLLFTEHLGDFEYKMLGFIPANKLQEFNVENLIHIGKLPQAYPDLFLPNHYDIRIKERKDPTIQKTLIGCLTKVRLNYE